MRVYIANFGRANWAWPSCLQRQSVATMTDSHHFAYWQAGDRESFLVSAMAGKTAAGLSPTRAVASRWFNLMTAIADTSGDLWIHREKDQLWWTVSKADAPTFERLTEPLPDKRDVVMCYKRCEPWQNVSRSGNPLPWKGLHPKAREFLFTEGTLQQLGEDNAQYALALIEGSSLAPWHNLSSWKAKEDKSKTGAATVFNARQRAVARMAMTAKQTTAGANGQTVQTLVKNKELFIPHNELEPYIDALIDGQDGRCALSGLPLQFDGDSIDPQMLASLDRIDSNAHYEKGNLQVVCRFINFWKSNMPDAEFRRLMNLVQDVERV